MILPLGNKIDSKNNIEINGWINLCCVYKIPIAFRSEIGKINYKYYREVINTLNSYHKTNNLKESIQKAVVR